MEEVIQISVESIPNSRFDPDSGTWVCAAPWYHCTGV